jgi:hypothetical protein
MEGRKSLSSWRHQTFVETVCYKAMNGMQAVLVSSGVCLKCGMEQNDHCPPFYGILKQLPTTRKSRGHSTEKKQRRKKKNCLHFPKIHRT